MKHPHVAEGVTFSRADGSVGSLTLSNNHMMIKLTGAVTNGTTASSIQECELALVRLSSHQASFCNVCRTSLQCNSAGGLRVSLKKNEETLKK